MGGQDKRHIHRGILEATTNNPAFGLHGNNYLSYLLAVEETEAYTDHQLIKDGLMSLLANIIVGISHPNPQGSWHLNSSPTTLNTLLNSSAIMVCMKNFCQAKSKESTIRFGVQVIEAMEQCIIKKRLEQLSTMRLWYVVAKVLTLMKIHLLRVAEEEAIEMEGSSEAEDLNICDALQITFMFTGCLLAGNSMILPRYLAPLNNATILKIIILITQGSLDKILQGGYQLIIEEEPVVSSSIFCSIWQNSWESITPKTRDTNVFATIQSAISIAKSPQFMSMVTALAIGDLSLLFRNMAYVGTKPKFKEKKHITVVNEDVTIKVEVDSEEEEEKPPSKMAAPSTTNLDVAVPNHQSQALTWHTPSTLTPSSVAGSSAPPSPAIPAGPPPAPPAPPAGQHPAIPAGSPPAPSAGPHPGLHARPPPALPTGPPPAPPPPINRGPSTPTSSKGRQQDYTNDDQIQITITENDKFQDIYDEVTEIPRERGKLPDQKHGKYKNTRYSQREARYPSPAENKNEKRRQRSRSRSPRKNHSRHYRDDRHSDHRNMIRVDRYSSDYCPYRPCRARWCTKIHDF